MIKTNRFIQCILPQYSSLTSLLRAIPRIFCDDQERVKAFKGYAMPISVRAQDDESSGDSDAESDSSVTRYMIPLEQCRGLIETINQLNMPTEGEALDISLVVAPYLDAKSPIQAELFESFFNVKGVQESLLKPFREGLSGVEHFKITGVDKSLAEAVQQEVAKAKWKDHKALLEDLRRAKQRGNDAFKAKEMRSASNAWEDALLNIEEIRQGSSWTTLVAKGGTPFVDAIAELCFLLALNVMYVQLMGAEKPINGYPSSYDKYEFARCAAFQVCRARFCRKRHWWRRGYKWHPSRQQDVKFVFRRAMVLKLQSEVGEDYRVMLDAIKMFDVARSLAPNDPVVKREMEALEQKYTRALCQMTPQEITMRRIFDDTDEEERAEEAEFDDDEAE